MGTLAPLARYESKWATSGPAVLWCLERA